MIFKAYLSRVSVFDPVQVFTTHVDLGFRCSLHMDLHEFLIPEK